MSIEENYTLPGPSSARRLTRTIGIAGMLIGGVIITYTGLFTPWLWTAAGRWLDARASEHAASLSDDAMREVSFSSVEEFDALYRVASDELVCRYDDQGNPRLFRRLDRDSGPRALKAVDAARIRLHIPSQARRSAEMEQSQAAQHRLIAAEAEQARLRALCASLEERTRQAAAQSDRTLHVVHAQLAAARSELARLQKPPAAEPTRRYPRAPIVYDYGRSGR